MYKWASYVQQLDNGSQVEKAVVDGIGGTAEGKHVHVSKASGPTQ